MKLANIDLEQVHVKTLEDGQSIKLNANHERNQAQVDLYRQQLGKRVRFELINGRIGAIEAEAGDLEWSMNIKKGILALLQLSERNATKLEGQDKLYRVYEENLAGICEAEYELVEGKSSEAQKDSEFNVTKTINLDNCLTDASHSYDRRAFRIGASTRRGQIFAKALRGLTGSKFGTAEHMHTQMYDEDEHDDHKMSGYKSPVQSVAFARYQLRESMGERIIQSVHAEAHVKYIGAGDLLVSSSEQRLELLDDAILTGAAKDIATSLRAPVERSESLKFEMSSQKQSFFNAYLTRQHHDEHRQAAFSHKMALPFVPSASWFPLVSGEWRKSDETLAEQHFAEPARLSRAVAAMLHSIAKDLSNSGVGAESQQVVGEKLVQLVNSLPLLPSDSLDEMFEHIEGQMRALASDASDEKLAEWRIVRKLLVDTLPLSGAKQAVELALKLIAERRVTDGEACALCESISDNLRYADTEVVDALLALLDLPHVRANSRLLSSCAISSGKLIAEAARHMAHSRRQTPTEGPLDGYLQRIVRRVRSEASPRSEMRYASAADEAELERLMLDEADVGRYVEQLARLLINSQELSERIALIEALAHTQSARALPHLRAVLTAERGGAMCLSERRARELLATGAGKLQADCNYIRTIAAYACAHLARVNHEAVEALLLPILDDLSEPHELRIAAFTTIALAGSLKTHVLERLAAQMWREPSRELASFVVDSLDTMANMCGPHFATRRESARRALELAPKHLLGDMSASWFTGGDHLDAKTKTSLNWLAQLVKQNSTASDMPRAGYMRIARTIGKSQWLNLLETGFVSAGAVDRLVAEYVVEQAARGNLLAAGLKRAFESRTELVAAAGEMLKTGSGEQDAGSTPHSPILERNAKLAMTNRKMSVRDALGNTNTASSFKLGLKDDVELAKLTVFTKLYEQTSYMSLNKRQLLELLDEASAFVDECVAKLRAGRSVHFVKLLMPNSMWHVVPSALGVPLVASHREPMLLSLKLTQGSAGTESVVIEPKVMVSSYRFLLAVDQATGNVFGAQTENSKQMSLPLELSFELGGGGLEEQLVVSAAPALDKKLGWTKRVGKTFVAKVQLDKSFVEFNWLGDERLIRATGSGECHNAERTCAAADAHCHRLDKHLVVEAANLELVVEAASNDAKLLATNKCPFKKRMQATGCECAASQLTGWLHVLDSLAMRPSRFLEASARLRKHLDGGAAPIVRVPLGRQSQTGMPRTRLQSPHFGPNSIAW